MNHLLDWQQNCKKSPSLIDLWIIFHRKKTHNQVDHIWEMFFENLQHFKTWKKMIEMSSWIQVISHGLTLKRTKKYVKGVFERVLA